MILFDVIMLVFLILVSGFASEKILKLDIKSLSTITIYVLTSPLIFRVFYDTPLNRGKNG